MSKNAYGAVTGRIFSPPGAFLVTFGTHLGPKMDAFGPTFGRLSWLFGPLLVDMWLFFARGRPGRVPGSILGAPGGPQDGFGRDFARISDSNFVQSLVQILSKFQISGCSVVGCSPYSPVHKLKGRWSRGAL